MAPPETLRALVRGRLPQDTDPDALCDELCALLLDNFGAAQRAYPGIELTAEAFAAHVLDRLPEDTPPLVALHRLHAADLYLACACARGDTGAFAVFEQRCLGPLDGMFGKMRIAADVRADVAQEIRSRVLVGHGGPPEIVDFAGRGDLRGWIRVMAMRRALQRRAGARREAPLEDDDLLQRIVALDDPALDQTKGVYRREFKHAFERALHALPDRQRTLLRQHHVDGLTIDELAGLYRVHRSTAARLVMRARMAVLRATRDAMKSRFDVDSRDLDSILRMIWSKLDVSLHGLRRARKR